MTKQEFIASLAGKTKLSKKDARAVVDAALDLIISSVKRGEKVTLTGFGTFEARQRGSTRKRCASSLCRPRPCPSFGREGTSRRR
jgi:DNA-binding protein HU-beta